MSIGPFETEREASSLPQVRAIYEAFDRDPGAGKMRPHNRRLLDQSLEAAGVAMGAYDDRIAGWLAGWEPHVLAVIAGWASRANRGEAVQRPALADVQRVLVDQARALVHAREAGDDARVAEVGSSELRVIADYTAACLRNLLEIIDSLTGSER